MVDLSNYPHPTYESNKVAASVVAALIGISMIAWIIQSIQSHFQPRRIIILILISHLTIFIELILLAVLPINVRNSRAALTAITVLFSISQRVIIVSNYDFLIRVGEHKSCTSRAISIGPVVGAVGSAIIMAVAGTLSYNTDTIDESFRLRQASAAIVLCMTVLFYPIWFVTKTIKHMTKQAIILLIISSITSLIVAIFLMITSIPYYYVGAGQQEFWFYSFQFTPIAIALITWVVLHPKRSLMVIQQQQKDIKTTIEDSL